MIHLAQWTGCRRVVAQCAVRPRWIVRRYGASARSLCHGHLALRHHLTLHVARGLSAVLGRVLTLMVESTDSLVQGLRSLDGLLLLFPELLERPRPLPVVEETRSCSKC